MTTTIHRLTAPALGLLLFLTACTGTELTGDDSGDASTTQVRNDEIARADDAAGAGSGEAAMADEDSPPDADQAGSVDLDAAAQNRQVISRGEVRIRVDDLDTAVGAVQELVEDLDGLVFAEDTDLRTGARTHLTLKVPPARFREALSALGGLGEVQTQTVSTDDVTDQVVDLDSRIATSAASVERLRVLLDRAERIQDIARIEGQLLQRETDLETLRGQRRTIEDQIALATIEVTLGAERTSPPPPEPEEEPQSGFLDGLRGGTDALRTVAVGLSAVAGTLLPWSPFVLLALWLTRRHWRPRLRATTAAG